MCVCVSERRGEAGARAWRTGGRPRLGGTGVATVCAGWVVASVSVCGRGVAIVYEGRVGWLPPVLGRGVATENGRESSRLAPGRVRGGGK